MAEETPVAFKFKDLRKIGATAINSIAGQDVQKLYRTASFEDSDLLLHATAPSLLPPVSGSGAVLERGGRQAQKGVTIIFRLPGMLV